MTNLATVPWHGLVAFAPVSQNVMTSLACKAGTMEIYKESVKTQAISHHTFVIKLWSTLFALLVFKVPSDITDEKCGIFMITPMNTMTDPSDEQGFPGTRYIQTDFSFSPIPSITQSKKIEIIEKLRPRNIIYNQFVACLTTEEI